MKNYLDSSVITTPLRNSHPLRQWIKAGWVRLILAAVLLGAGYLAWAWNLIVHNDWTAIIVPVYKKLFSAQSGFIFIDLRGAGFALLAFVILFLIGVLSAEILLPQEKDRWLKRLAALLLGFGLIGSITSLLAAYFQLHLSTLCIALFAVFLFLVFGKIGWGFKSWSSISTQVKEWFLVWKIGKEDFSNNRKKLLFAFCLIIFGIMEYQALRFIEFDWDALIYHANMAKIMFNYGGVPVIAGPSAGLELSANYPPLFSALGAYFYVIAGQFNDTYLRMLAPIFSLLTLLTVYKIGSALGDTRYGTIAAVLLVLTPLYFSRSLYATNYLPATAFLTAALLFFLLGFQTRDRHYWPLSGLMFGFALLTSYHAVVFVPSMLILSILSIYWKENQERKVQLRYCLAALSLAFVIYGIWLLRNTIYLHNPMYPFASQLFGGLHFDAQMFQRTVSAIRNDSIFNYFGTYTPSLPVYFQRLFINRSQFPVFSILLILGAMLIPFDANRRGWAMVGLYILPVSVTFASTLINIFPRYFVLVLPESALIVAFLFTRILTWGSFSFVTTGPTGLLKYKSYSTTTHILAGILLGLMFVFPGNLAVVLGKQYGEADIYKPNYWKQDPGSQDVYNTLAVVYGSGIRAWEWLRPKIASPNVRVASFENRTYYLTDNVNTMLYLDGLEGKPLYAMNDPQKAFSYLQSRQVKYILDPYWVKNWNVYRLLPLNRFLGNPEYFPLVFDSPEAKIYQVGRISDPLTNHSPLAINLSQEGWSQPEIRNGSASRRIEKNNTNARLFISNARRITLRVEYLDTGTSTVDLNLKKADGTWDYSTHIVLTNTNRWLTQDLKLPPVDHPDTVEIGIFSQSSDFIVKSISASPSQ